MEEPRLEDKQPVGKLHVFRNARRLEADYLLYPGLNVIGRKSNSDVILPFPSISRKHAIIEITVQGTEPLLFDCGSRNGSSLLSVRNPLIPWVKYHLREQDLIFFSKVCCQYHQLGAPLLPGPQRALPLEESLRLPRMEASLLQGALQNEESSKIEGHLDKDQHLTGRAGNRDSDADVIEENNFDDKTKRHKRKRVTRSHLSRKEESS
ncbi:mediator of DNA damage checkpoint protein 1-like [Macrotis lagotis]|uniref:mediator of DNA damage checkpoint protein 1-like n=1 Tax=Macrotis lagotis TaxID=92651 RepID=UPI003D69AA56